MELRREIESYFDYRWGQDKFKVINPFDASNFLEQVPEFVENNLLCTFLFENFLTAYSRTFELPMIGPRKHMKYTWENFMYRNFMVNILCNLEPIKFAADTIILDELDETSCVYFLLHNVIFHIGYGINKKAYFKIK